MELRGGGGARRLRELVARPEAALRRRPGRRPRARGGRAPRRAAPGAGRPGRRRPVRARRPGQGAPRYGRGRGPRGRRRTAGGDRADAAHHRSQRGDARRSLPALDRQAARRVLGVVRVLPALGGSRRPQHPGTLRTARARLPAIAAMGFDIVYLPPIHPIGVTHRKGANNSLDPGPDDPGSPWAIGDAGGRSHRDPPRPRQHQGLRRLRRGGAQDGARGGARLRAAVQS